MSKNEIVFYFGVGSAALLNEIGIQFNFAICTLLPSMLIVGRLGSRAFPHPVSWWFFEAAETKSLD